MGCASSKRIEATVDVYRPPPTSFAVFDINSIEEPWLKGGNNKVEEDELDQDELEEYEKPTKVAQPILEKLNSSIDDAPRSWDEVSKALEDLKPTLQNPPPLKSPKKPLLALPAPPSPAAEEDGGGSPKRKIPRKSFSFHTLEELESKLSPKDAKKSNEVKKKELMFSDEENKKFEKFSNNNSNNNIPSVFSRGGAQTQQGYKPVKENIFLLRDKMEREKEGKVSTFVKFNPLDDYPEKCPPRGEDSLVVYTTTLGGVRRTFEDCNKVRLILESHRVVFDERDVALHGEFRQELKELVGEDYASVPRLFVKGRYIGGVDEVVHLNETKRLGRILNWARVEKGLGRIGCEGCGGARFVPCFDCGGSCKVVMNGDVKERCPKCNENGLIHCPICN